MSKIKLIIALFILPVSILFSQEHCRSELSSIYLDLNDRALESHEIDKDTMNAHFNVYLKKYESKKEREKAIEIYKDKIKNIKTSGINPSEVRLPTFSIGFLVYNERPERLKSLKGIKFITLKEFRDKGYKTSMPTYIIHKLKDGTYLRWSTVTMDEI